MNRADVTELHYIAAIANVPSILKHGILSHTLAAELAHDSVAMPEIQERRRNKQIPGAGPLHGYANFISMLTTRCLVGAGNAMMRFAFFGLIRACLIYRM